MSAACRPGSKPSSETASSSAQAAHPFPLPSASGSALRASNHPLLPLFSREPDPQSPRLRDPLWLAARDEDALESQRLAESAGVSGLLLGLEDGGEPARTALRALPYAADAEAALGTLAELALQAGGDDLGPILETVLFIAKAPAHAREALDPEGARACAQATLALSKRLNLPQQERALAISATRAFATKDLLDASSIPTDLDPP